MFLKILRFICRVIVLPVVGLILFISALIEAMKLEPDLYYWKDQNEFFLSILPWKPL